MIIRATWPAQAPSSKGSAKEDRENISSNMPAFLTSAARHFFPVNRPVDAGRSPLCSWLLPSRTHCFLGGRFRRGGLVIREGIQELIDAERLVQHRAQALLAGLDDGVRGVVTVSRHEDHLGLRLGLAEPAVHLVARQVRQADVR